jgi:hypothetical protein
VLGVDNAVGLARAHPAAIKSLVLISGETFGEGLQFLRQAAQRAEGARKTEWCVSLAH